MVPRQGTQAIVVCRSAEKIDRNRHSGPQTPALHLADGCLQALRIDIEGVQQHVYKDGRRAEQYSCLGRGDEGKGRHEVRVAWADPLGKQQR